MRLIGTRFTVGRGGYGATSEEEGTELLREATGMWNALCHTGELLRSVSPVGPRDRWHRARGKDRSGAGVVTPAQDVTRIGERKVEAT
jgi:hypothetical protein